MDILYLLDLFGSFVFALSGCILAARKTFDVFGFFIVGFFTAVGGGTFRDVIIGNVPVFWLNDMYYVLVVTAAAVLTFLLTNIIRQFENLLQIMDALGIGVFTLIGIRIGLEKGLIPFFAVMMGVVTAVFGGIVRDILCNEIPLIFHREIYATACIIGGIVFIILNDLPIQDDIINFSVIICIVVVRLVSLKYNLSLPRKNEN